MFHLPPVRPMRILAGIRNKAPCALFIPGFLYGQCLAWYLGYYSFLVLLGTWGLGFLIYGRWAIWARSSVGISILPGILSILFLLPTPSRENLDANTSYLVKVDEIPRFKSPGGVELSLQIIGEVHYDEKNLETFSLSSYSQSSRALCKTPHLPWKGAVQAKRGVVGIIKASFKRLETSLNPFSWPNTLGRRGYSYSCRINYFYKILDYQPSLLEKVHYIIKKDIISLLGGDERSGLFLAMVMGERDALSDLTSRAFQKTGLMHVLVVSGYQISIVFLVVLKILRICFANLTVSYLLFPVPFISYLLSLFVSALYVALVGLDGSTFRAAIAQGMLVISGLLERGGGLGNSITGSFLLLSIIWPCCYFEPGIQLTYGALIGIWLGNILPVEGVWKYLAICSCASFFASLVAAIWFNSFSFWTFILNPMLAPLVSLVGCLGGLLGLMLFYSGVDGSGLVLKGVGCFLGWLCDLVLYLGG